MSVLLAATSATSAVIATTTCAGATAASDFNPPRKIILPVPFKTNCDENVRFKGGG